MEAVCAFHYYALILNADGLSEANKLKIVCVMSRGGKIFRHRKNDLKQTKWIEVQAIFTLNISLEITFHCKFLTPIYIRIENSECHK